MATVNVLRQAIVKTWMAEINPAMTNENICGNIYS